MLNTQYTGLLCFLIVNAGHSVFDRSKHQDKTAKIFGTLFECVNNCQSQNLILVRIHISNPTGNNKNIAGYGWASRTMYRLIDPEEY